jgi:hypothetical protein
MAGSNNFQIFNPLKNNQKSDAAYESDTMRSGGAVSGVFPAATFNKMMYQLSVFIYAFAESLKTKGYEVEDTDVATLIAVFAEVLTLADSIQSDWLQTDPSQLDYIKNKPTIIDPVQSDWAETDTESLAFIKNKDLVTTEIGKAKLMANVQFAQGDNVASVSLPLTPGTWAVMAQARFIEGNGAAYTFLINGVQVDAFQSANYEGAEIYKLMGMTSVVVSVSTSIVVSVNPPFPSQLIPSHKPKILVQAIRTA